MMLLTALLSVLFLLVGLTSGWFFSDKYRELLIANRHEFDELFESNPHPEIFDREGKINRGEYVTLSFDLGYDPEDFDPEDITEV